MPVPGQNPFARVFSPSRGGVLGTIGRFAGFPSDEEALVARMGRAQASGLQALQNKIQNGADPQRALIDFVNTPEGMEYFIRGGELSDLTGFMEATKPERPELVQGGYGTFFGNRDPKTGAITPEYTVPTEEVQTTTGLGELANLTEDKLGELALAQLQGNVTGDMTALERAVSASVTNGDFDERTGRDILSGVLSVETDPRTGRTKIVNMATQEEFFPEQPGELGGSETVEGQAAAEPESREFEGKPPGSIITGAGLVAGIQSRLGQVAGEINPSLAAAETNKNRIAIEKIISSATTLRQNTRLKADVDAVKEVVEMRNSTPINAGNKLLSFMDYVENRDTQAIAIIADKNASIEERNDAEAWLNSSELLWQDMPDRADLEATIQGLQSGETASPAKGAASAIPKLAGDAINSLVRLGKDQGPQTGRLGQRAPEQKPARSYATMEEADAAFRRGEFGVNDPVIIGGVRGTAQLRE